MANKNELANDTAEREISISRILNAPRELVFKVWTDPEHIIKWWGPNGFTNTIHKMDVKPGGQWDFIMHGPDGNDYPNKIEYNEVVEPERLVFTHLPDEATNYNGFVITATFKEMGNKTELHMQMLFHSIEDKNKIEKEHNAIEGNKQTINRLESYLANLQGNKAEGFTISRIFNAPRELVFKAWTEMEHMAKWFGPKGFTMGVTKMDLRPGGIFHYSMHSPDGHEMWGKFVYREVVAPEKLVLVNSFSDAEGNNTRHPMSATWPLEVLSTITFTEHEGKTKLTIHGIPINATEEEQNTFNASTQNMEQGWSGTFSQLDEYLSNVQTNDTTPIVMERIYNAPIARVWKALTDNEEMKQWYFKLAEFRAEPGFEFRFSGGPKDGPQYLHICVVTEVIDGRKIAYSWRYDGYSGNSLVSFELFEDGDKTRLVLTHSGLETFPADMKDFAKGNFVEGWNHITGKSLKEYVER